MAVLNSTYFEFSPAGNFAPNYLKIKFISWCCSTEYYISEFKQNLISDRVLPRSSLSPTGMEKVNDVVIPIFSDPYGSMFKYAHAPDGTFNDGHGKCSYKIHSGPENLKKTG